MLTAHHWNMKSYKTYKNKFVSVSFWGLLLTGDWGNVHAMMPWQTAQRGRWAWEWGRRHGHHRSRPPAKTLPLSRRAFWWSYFSQHPSKFTTCFLELVLQRTPWQKILRVDLNPLKKKATSFEVRNVMIDFPTLFFEMVPKTCQGSFFLPALAW